MQNATLNHIQQTRLLEAAGCWYKGLLTNQHPLSVACTKIQWFANTRGAGDSCTVMWHQAAVVAFYEHFQSCLRQPGEMSPECIKEGCA